MLQKRDNYALQAEDARLRFLTYDQTSMPVQMDETYLYLPFCGCDYRICRADGHVFRRNGESWLSSDSHGEVLTIFDYLCNAKPGRVPAGEFASIISLGGYLHGKLGSEATPLDNAIDHDPACFCRACEALGCTSADGGDLCFQMLLFPDLPVLLRFWHADEDFPPKLDILWDKNALRFLHYETLWFAAGVLRCRLRDTMESVKSK